MSVCFRLFVVLPFVRGGAEAATELGPQRREQSGWGSESVEGWGLPGDVALGFSVLPCCAAVFNDNMVAQAVAAPLRKCEGEVGRGGEGVRVGGVI